MSLINKDVPSIPKQKMEEFMWVISGRNKIGKTTLASQFPKPYFFLFEPGSSTLATYETDILKEAQKRGKHEWEIFRDAVDEFVSNQGYGFKTAVIDPVSTAYDYCEDFVTKREGVNHISDLPFGQGYSLVRDEYSSVIKKLHSGYTIPLAISHTKDKNKEDGLGNTTTVVDLDITGKSGKFLKNYTDIFLLLDFNEEGKRKIFVRPSTSQEAGSRLNFEKKEIDMSFEALKEEFDKAIKKNNDKLGITKKMIKESEKATKQKREEKTFKQLINDIAAKCQELGLSKKDNAKEMKEKYGTPSLGKLTYEQAQDRVEELKGRL
jgi:hypothetical protein